MKPKLSMESGQALILIALAAIGLFGIVGLAIDGGIKFSDRRHAQNAADAAALAGALELAREEAPHPSKLWDTVARDIADSNGYDGSLITNQVWVHKCDAISVSSPVDCGPYNGDPEYIQVAIRSRVNTYFARVLGIGETVNTVQSVTRAREAGPLYDGNLIVALNPNPCSGTGADGNIVLGTSGGGEAAINLTGGGAYINSDGSGCGMTLTGCPVVTITGGSIGSSGDGNIDLASSSGSCSSTVTAPAPIYNQDPYPFPPAMPATPSECTSPMGTYSSNGATLTTTLTPGKYYEFPPKGTPTHPVYDRVHMAPGIYCIEDMVKLNDQALILTGTDVMFYFRSGYKFDISGGTIQLDAPDTGPYAGYLFILDSDFTGSPQNCTINGNGTNIYTGTIFAPYCNVTLNGTSEPTSYSAQLIAYTVKVNGNASVNLTYDESNSAKDDPLVGLMR